MEMEEELKETLMHHPNNTSLESVEKEESLRKRAWEESKKMWVVAGPAIFTRFSTFGIMVVSQSFIGHIGSTELAAYAIVMTVLVRFANGVLVSVSLPLDEIKLLYPNKNTKKGIKFKSKQFEFRVFFLKMLKFSI